MASQGWMGQLAGGLNDGLLSGGAAANTTSSSFNNASAQSNSNWSNTSLGGTNYTIAIDTAQPTASSTVVYTFTYNVIPSATVITNLGSAYSQQQYINQNVIYPQVTFFNQYITSLNFDTQLTPEQQAVADAQRVEREQKRKDAEARAEELLLCCLSPGQIKQYEEHGYFETEVNDKVYRIKKGRSGNVYLVDGGVEKYRYCAHPTEWTPDQDVMLSQMLILKTDEKKFLQTANRTVLYAGR